MRSEEEMMNLILGIAGQDERTRAVLMQGSRTNPRVKRDFFQDYDIVFIVDAIESFLSDDCWIDVFGDRIILQMPEAKVLPPAHHDGRFVYLMWFKDGNRIDLTLLPRERMGELYQPDSLNRVLLDKDGLMGSLPPSSDLDYHITRPSKQEYLGSCNEFWWISMNISKGMWRGQLPYVMYMYEQINRNELIRMITWRIGIQTNFSLSSGAFGKYIEDYLEPEEWRCYVSTYTNAETESIWEALFTMCGLFREMAIQVADYCGFEYPYEDDRNVSAHLRHIRALPKDAREMYE